MTESREFQEPASQGKYGPKELAGSSVTSSVHILSLAAARVHIIVKRLEYRSSQCLFNALNVEASEPEYERISEI